MTTKTCDAIVIGGGPGGYVCAIRLGQFKQRVVCIEKEEVGGVCLNWGCIPSKALISTAHVVETAQHASGQGVKFSNVEVDFGATQDWKNGVVKKLTTGVRQLLKANGVTLVIGTARVIERDKVQVTLADGTTEIYEAAKAIVIATGSATAGIPSLPFDGVSVIGAREAVNLRQIPKRLCVIGGGVIGLELGTTYKKLGSELTVVEALPNLLNGVDAECVQVVERKLTRGGAKIYKNARALGCDRQADGSVALRVQIGEAVQTIVCDVLLVSVGMKPVSRGIGLEEIGVRIDERGFVTADRTGRTNVEGVYAIGDVSGPPLLAHKASKEGEVVAGVIAGHSAQKDWVTIPGAVFTDPEIGSAGLTAEQARDMGEEVLIGKFPFAALGKAIAMGQTDGFVKVVASKATHKLLGVHIVGPNATDLISEGVAALELGAFAEDIAMSVHPHPTLGEAMMEASAHALGQAIHAINR